MKKELKKGLIVSCQATKEEPMYGSDIMARLAIAAQEGGAVGVRVNTYPDLVAVRQATDLPILGLIKQSYEGYYPYITPTMEEVRKVIASGADIVCIDATHYSRPDGLDLRSFVQRIRKEYPDVSLLGDIATVDDGIYAEHIGLDYVATTLSGYTPDTKDQNNPLIMELRDPDLEIIRELSNIIHIPIIAEGRFWNETYAIRAMECGAYAVTIGAGITRPQIITKKIVDAMKASLHLE